MRGAMGWGIAAASCVLIASCGGSTDAPTSAGAGAGGSAGDAGAGGTASSMGASGSGGGHAGSSAAGSSAAGGDAQAGQGGSAAAGHAGQAGSAAGATSSAAGASSVGGQAAAGSGGASGAGAGGDSSQGGTSGECGGSPDFVDCSAEPDGTPIVWPTGMPIGACKYGSAACDAGKVGQCIGAVAPGTEICNGLDDDCNGIVDDGPPPTNAPLDAILFVYDGDLDNHAPPFGGQERVRACLSSPPTTPPAACTKGPFDGCTLGNDAAACCPSTGWRTSNLPSDDCNDQNPNVSPGAPEICNGVDDNCDGQIDGDQCLCEPGSTQSTCSALPDGSTIVYPTGVPLGNCHYGTTTCAPNGTWGPCVGAVAPKPTDDCSIKGDDSNCNGLPNDGC